MKRLLVFVALLLALCAGQPANAQQDCFNGYLCLELRSICGNRWQIVNPDRNWSGEVTWQIWSAYDWDQGEEPPIILYEGHVEVRQGPSRATFSTPIGARTMILRGPEAVDDIQSPAGRPCVVRPPRSCTNIFKVLVPGELRVSGAQFVIYHVGDVFLDDYSDDDLGFDIQMGAINPGTGEISLLLCQDAWPGSKNFVGMVEINGIRTPIIEFSLSDAWPDVLVVWTAPGVTNAP